MSTPSYEPPEEIKEAISDFVSDYRNSNLRDCETVVVQYIEIVAALYEDHMIHPVDCMIAVKDIIAVHKERMAIFDEKYPNPLS